MAAQHSCVQDLVSEVTFKKVESMLQVTSVTYSLEFMVRPLSYCDVYLINKPNRLSRIQSTVFQSVVQSVVFDGDFRTGCRNVQLLSSTVFFRTAFNDSMTN